MSGDLAVSPLVRHARRLSPLLAKHAAETELAGDIAPPCLALMKEAGMFSMLAPRAAWGPDSGLPAVVEALVELGRGCGSTAWVAMILSGGCALVSLLDDEVCDEVWGGDPHAAVATVTSPSGVARKVSFGWHVSGRWQPASGVRHAQWVLVGTPVPGDRGKDEITQMLIPASEIRIEPTWSAPGMRGTASDTIIADDVFVPNRRALSFSRALSGGYATRKINLPLAAVPIVPFLATIAVGPVLGMVDSALAHALGLIRERGAIVGTDYSRAVYSPAVQLSVAKAVGLIDGAHLHVDRAVGVLSAAMKSRTGLDAAAAARTHMDVGVASTQIREAIGLLMDSCAARGFASASPLQRIWRDIEVACRHQLLVADASRERLGRALLDVGGQAPER
ncbi:oxidoreductase [Kutzneria buriramensis]|uniref:Alkylation response protein AidB-like acyl-CoA dehydrogenase n=1 Tax=Kutzneria buriramensis TaxID=1045776 RepID=A0A3E0GYE1_9PSEU|nr:oxidoreductase [Kutzneria buriramensis]REH33129.1 alkylation response protein AidB-like acyl-CoA dehydrogenase [Kutzneria buriramensis]